MRKTVFALLFIFLAIAIVSVPGFYGSLFVYAEKGPAAPDLKKGEQLYAANCGGCHPNGGNTINPGLPVLKSPKLGDVNTFIGFNRNPVMPDGSRGAMPSFPEDKLSDNDMKLIYQYVTGVLAKKGK